MLNTFNTSVELDESRIDTAVLPLGSLEPKGPHLPLGLDIILANRFAYDLCRNKSVYLLPVFPFSGAVECRGFPGSIALSQETLWNVLYDLAGVLAKQAFRRLVVLDFSNHNWIVKQAVREINMDGGLIQAVWVNPKEFARAECPPQMLPDHGGGALETSLALALEQIPVTSLPEDHLPEQPREYNDYAGYRALAPGGYWGRPSRGEAKIGKILYRRMLEGIRDFLDYSFGLFAKGSSLASSEADRELWWPEGNIPGILGEGPDWYGSWRSVADGEPGLAVIATSATEQHSPSMPLATDHLQCLEISRRVAGRLKAYLLPTLPVVSSWGHIRFRGTLTFRAMTVRRILSDVFESLYEGGLRRMLLVNVHGGNWVIKPTIIELNRRYPDARLVTTGDSFAYRGQRPVEQLHACEGEASFIKAFYPDCLKEQELVDYSPQCPASAFDLVGIGGVSPRGVWGYPSRSTVEQGRARIEARVEEALACVSKVFEDLEQL